MTIDFVLLDKGTDTQVYINPNQVRCVRGSPDGAEILSDKDFSVTVKEHPRDAVKRLCGKY